MGLKSLLLFTAVLGSSLAHPTSHGNLRGEDASRTLELSNFTEYVRSSFDSLSSSLRGLFGSPRELQPLTCLCIVDVDRTLTGRQGDTMACPGNRVVSGSYDDAYGGGNLTLSQLGQHVWETFCGSCYVRAITAHPHRRPNIPVAESVVDCNEGCKANEAARLAGELGVAKEEVYMFDDKAENIDPFRGTGMNAHQVSCGTREGTHGLCGADLGEIRNSKGVTTCPMP